MREQVLEIRTTDSKLYLDLFAFLNEHKRADGTETLIRIIDEHPEQTISEIQRLIDNIGPLGPIEISEQEKGVLPSLFADTLDLPESDLPQRPNVPPGCFLDDWMFEQIADNMARNLMYPRYPITLALHWTAIEFGEEFPACLVPMSHTYTPSLLTKESGE